jgi:hypothetical protein
MTSFASAKDAKEFLVAQIVDEAQREGVPLSEIERKMLYFSERFWTLPDIMEVNEKFDEQYDETAYEKKIAGLIAGAFKRAKANDPAAAQTWLNAIGILNREDHYILVMTNQAGLRDKSARGLSEMSDPVSTQPPSTYFLGALAFALLLALVMFSAHFGLIGRSGLGFLHGSVVISDRLNALVRYGWLAVIFLALAVLLRRR